jgi:hypothetical protein
MERSLAAAAGLAISPLQVGAAVAANLVSETGDLVALLLEIRERGDIDPLMRVAIGMNLAGLGTYLTAAFLLKNGADSRAIVSPDPST